MKVASLVAIALCAACAGSSSTEGNAPSGAELGRTHESIRSNGPLSLALKDYPANPDIVFALPSVAPRPGRIVVEHTRYGSLCRFDVSGDAKVDGRTVAVRIAFAERLTMCTAEIRALQYSATVSGLSGQYQVFVIHEQNATADTVVRTSVVVP